VYLFKLCKQLTTNQILTIHLNIKLNGVLDASKAKKKIIKLNAHKYTPIFFVNGRLFYIYCSYIQVKMNQLLVEFWEFVFVSLRMSSLCLSFLEGQRFKATKNNYERTPIYFQLIQLLWMCKLTHPCDICYKKLALVGSCYDSGVGLLN
jgi:hypothetical protein